MKPNRLYQCLTWIGLFKLFLVVSPVLAQTTGTLASGFSLDDQYGKRYQIQYPQEKICVLVFADKWGSTQVESWVRPLYERYKDGIIILGVAQLDNVPGKVQPLLIDLFKRTIKYPVMLDWTGTVAKKYGYPGGKALVVVVNPGGVIQHRTLGKSTPAPLQKLYIIIDGLKSSRLTPSSSPQPSMQQAQGEANQQGTPKAPGQGDH